ncbi:MAG: class I SAM-dependent methyltransferase [Pseudomonadota bacterium]
MLDREDNHYYLGQSNDALLRYQLFNRAYQAGTEQVFSWLPLATDSQVLEVGCGIGATACYMAREIVPDGHVTAFDSAADLVDCGRRTAEQHGIDNITFVTTSAQEFECPPASYDLVHSRYVISYLPDASKILAMVGAALKPSGLFFGEEIAQNYMNHGDVSWYDNMTEWFAKLIEAGGGDPDYGLRQFAADVLAAGLSIEHAAAFWPLQEQSSVRRMLALALSKEMKQNLTELGLATEQEVAAVLAYLKADDVAYQISASMAVQLVARKPQAG